MSDRLLPGIVTPTAPKRKGGYRPGSGRPRQQVCKRGHDLSDPANVYITPKGYANCRACRAVRAANAIERAQEEFDE